MTAPHRGTVLVAALASAALIAVSGWALWRHMAGDGGDTPAERTAVIGPVAALSEAAIRHSDRCTEGLLALTRAADATDAAIDAMETCGERARAIAEQGYAALDEAAGQSTSEARAAYLDAAGALFSVHELQGDDFDLIFDMIHNARTTGAPLNGLGADTGHIIGNAAPDVAASRNEAARAETTYRSRG